MALQATGWGPWLKEQWDQIGPYIAAGATGALEGVSGGYPGMIIGASSHVLQAAIERANKGEATDEDFELISNYIPEIQNLANEVSQKAFQRLGSNDFDFQPIRESAIKNFEEEGIPSIVERLHGLTGGAGSDVFDKQVGRARAGLERDLAAQQQDYNMQRRNQDISIAALGQQTATGNPRESQPGWGSEFAGQLQKFAMDPERRDQAIGNLKKLGQAVGLMKKPWSRMAIPGTTGMLPGGNMGTPVTFGART